MYAPLADDGWYEREPLQAALGDEPVGLLLVDGPPADRPGRELARAPALPFFLPRLEPRAAVVLDDVWRAGEREVVARWEAESDLSFAVLPGRGHVAVGRVPHGSPSFTR